MKALIGFALTVVAMPVFGQTAQILKDRSGIPVIESRNVMVSRDDFLWVWLSITVKNLSGADLTDVALHISSIQRDGSRYKVQGGDGVDPRSLRICFDVESACTVGSVLKKDSTITMRKKVWCEVDEAIAPNAFCTGKFELSIDPAWQSPEDQKLQTANQQREEARANELKAEEEARANRMAVLKDRHGIPRVEISNMRISRDGPLHVWLTVVAKNISGFDLNDVVLDVSSIGKDASKSKALQGDGVGTEGLPVCYDLLSARPLPPGCAMSVFKKDSILTPSRIFWCPEDSCTKEFELSLNPAWQSPEDLKLEAAKQQRETALAAKYEAEVKAKANAKRVKVRTACAAVYKNTADRKVSDLTVNEEQQVRACQALGLYSTH